VRRLRAAGFTLIELMVVMVIIGLVVSGALLSLNTTGHDSQLEQERDRLGALIDYVRERADLQTVEYGLRCQQDGYQFVMYDSRKELWVADPIDDALRARVLPAGLDFQLKVEGKAIVLPQRNAKGAGSSSSGAGLGTVRDLTPQVMLFSNGDLSAFALTLERAGTGRSALIHSTTDNKVQSDALIEAPP